MQYPAQLQAVTELLDQLEETQSPADKLVGQYFKQRRYIGSKDKAVIANSFYTILRHRGEIDAPLTADNMMIDGRSRLLSWLLGRSTYSDSLEGIFSGAKYQMAKLSDIERAFCDNFQALTTKKKTPEAEYNMPEWLLAHLRDSVGDDALKTVCESLNEQAPTDIRINTLETSITAMKNVLKEADFYPKTTPLAPQGIRLMKRAPLHALPVFKQGWFEMQDEGSQILALVPNVKAGDFVVDYCAGAGGKTLSLAAQMNNKGRILACDIYEYKLTETKRRCKRAGVGNVQYHTLLPEGDKFIKRQKAKADVVFIDAPCSGTGTWRRSPDAKWKLTADNLADIIALQAEILQKAARLVKPGGRLIYATCSLLKAENEAQVEAFTQGNPSFEPAPLPETMPEKFAGQDVLRLAPHTTGTDGFFAQVWVRKQAPEASNQNDDAAPA